MKPSTPEDAARLDRLAWPAAQAGDALAALAKASGRAWRSSRPDSGRSTRDSWPPNPAGRRSSLAAWVEAQAPVLGLEAEPVASTYGQVERCLRACGPALLVLPAAAAGEDPRLLAVVRAAGAAGRRHAARGRLLAVGPDLAVRRVAIGAVAAAICGPSEPPAVAAVEATLAQVGLGRRRHARARQLLLRERLQQAPLEMGWLLRLPPAASFRAQCLQAGLAARLVVFVAGYAAAYGLLLASWWALGAGILQGFLARDALIAWALLLLSVVPFRALSVRARSDLVVGVGALFRRRLLAGTLRLRPDEIRHSGAGQLLGRVIESEAVETFGLLGSFLSVVGLVEVALAAAVLAAGASGARTAALLTLWLLAAAALSLRMHAARRRWTWSRLAMTHDLIEQLVGHRTRLVQEGPAQRHRAEDGELEAYLDTSRRFDRSRVALLAVVPRGWLLAGFAAVLPDLVAGTAAVVPLAIAVGGILAAYRGLAKCVEGLTHLSGAAISWQQAADLFAAASRDDERPASFAAWAAGAAGAILDARDLVFRHQGRGRPVLDGCSVRVAPGDRLLLTGPSGCGKSTLASLLAGQRRPDSGSVLLGGLDLHTVGGAAWRRRVALAPQFHENHVFTETLAFNLLMGRGWPPGPGDLEDAAAVCDELGLGGLVARMPAGLQQILGESGWQLSHGERSRLFLARALLQRAEMVILDESLAALDPENFLQSLDCALRRAPALLVVAHP
jgi:ATP-binding cassette subfamily B protein